MSLCLLVKRDLFFAFIFFLFFFAPLVLEVGDGVFEVLSTSGDTHLGGDDFDKVGHICACNEQCYVLSFLILSFSLHV